MFNNFDKRLNESKKKINQEEMNTYFPGGETQMLNIAKAIYYYSNQKIKPEFIFQMYMKFYTFYMENKDVYDYYVVMNLNYSKYLEFDELIGIIYTIIENNKNTNFTFEKDNEVNDNIDNIREIIINNFDEKDFEGASNDTIPKESIDFNDDINVVEEKEYSDNEIENNENDYNLENNKIENSIATLIKIFAIIFLILSIIGECIIFEDNGWFILIGIFFSFFFFIIICGFGEIIQLLEDIKNK